MLHENVSSEHSCRRDKLKKTVIKTIESRGSEPSDKVHGRTRSSRLLFPTQKVLTKEASASVTHIDTTINTANILELLCVRFEALPTCCVVHGPSAAAKHSKFGVFVRSSDSPQSFWVEGC
jgi:hypothetical protein